MTEKIKKETPWEKYKAANPERNARPWDLLNKDLRVDEKIAEERLALCLTCENFQQATKTCGICRCYMPAKTKLSNAFCPMHPPKWNKVEITTK